MHYSCIHSHDKKVELDYTLGLAKARSKYFIQLPKVHSHTDSDYSETWPTIVRLEPKISKCTGSSIYCNKLLQLPNHSTTWYNASSIANSRGAGAYLMAWDYLHSNYQSRFKTSLPIVHKDTKFTCLPYPYIRRSSRHTFFATTFLLHRFI